MWKQLSSDKLLTYIVLHSEDQTFNLKSEKDLPLFLF